MDTIQNAWFQNFSSHCVKTGMFKLASAIHALFISGQIILYIILICQKLKSAIWYQPTISAKLDKLYGGVVLAKWLCCFFMNLSFKMRILCE